MEYTAGCHLFYAARSSSKLNNDTRHEGTSYQVAYNKYLVQTATRFSVAAWRYASQDYRTFSDHLYENDKHYHQSDYDDFYDIGRKNSLSANIMQPLSNNLGNVSLSALWRNYWGEVEMLKITNSVTPITGNTLVILSLPANLMMKIIKKRSVLICLSPFLSTGG